MFGVIGLRYIPNFISPSQHELLTKTIDKQLWRTDLSRRTQHYGYVYDYRARTVDSSMYLGELPRWLSEVANLIHGAGLMPEVPDQAIVNEYLPGQGIADHEDCAPCFGDVISSLSLISPVVMDFKQDAQLKSLVLEPRSLLVLQGEARYRWTHGIARRKSDKIMGERVKRQRRLSVTFRNVVMFGNETRHDEQPS